MLASRIIPMLWFRLVIITGFMLFMLWEGSWIIGLVALLLLGVSAWQLRTAYHTRDSQKN